MTTRELRLHTTALLVSASLVLAACSSGSTSGNAAPRFDVIPAQILTGTSDLMLDLDPFVTDREGQVITYAVVSGGGAFAGSVYSNTFDTVGTYPVTVSATDTLGKNRETTFDVVVQTAELAVVRAGDDLQLMDTATLQFRNVASASGFSETMRGVLAKGHIVYERVAGADSDLFVYNPHTTETTVLGDTPENIESFGDITSVNDVVFTRESATDTALFTWNALTDLTLVIANEPNEHARNPMVNTGNLVFYELTNVGQGDIFYYDPAVGDSEPVSTAATDESLRGVLPDGGVVFSRIGPTGERDLFYFRLGVGTVEIGGDLGAPVPSQSKTFVGNTTDSKVLFEVTGAADLDLYVWNPTNGQSRAVALTASVDDTLAFVTALDEIVVNVATTPTNGDLHIYDYGTDTLSAISTDGDNDVYQGALSNGDVVFLREDATGDQLHLYDTSAGSSSTIVLSGGEDFAFDKVLANDNVVYNRAAGGPGEIFLYSGGSSTSILAGAVSFGGEAAGGDFVIAIDVAGQDDLSLYDESAAAVVPISVHAGDESFGFGLADGRILFMRVETGETNLDLHVWEPTPTVTRLTTTTADHSIVGVVTADDS